MGFVTFWTAVQHSPQEGRLQPLSKDEGKGIWKGTALDGGGTRTIQEGAVVVIEPGLPHWFNQINGIITYTTIWIYR